MKNKDFKKYLYISLTIFSAIALSITFFFLLYRLPEISDWFSLLIKALMPFIYGAVIAYILYPVCLFFEKLFKRPMSHIKKRSVANKLNRGISIFLSMVFGIAVIYFILAMIVPQIYTSIMKIVNNAPEYVDTIIKFVNEHLADNPTLKKNIYEIITKYTGDFTNILTNWGSQIGQILQGISSGVLSVVIVTKNLVIGIIVAIYLLAGRGTFKKSLKYFIELIFNKKWALSVKNELKVSNNIVGNFISGRILDSCIIGVLCYLGMIIIGIPYPVLVSVMVGVTNVIPFFGPFIGAIPAGVLILIESPIDCLWFAIFMIVLQQFDGNILGPSIIGDSLGLSSFWVLFSMLLFGGLFGIVGMIIGVPVFAIIYDVVKKLIKKWDEHKQKKAVVQIADSDEKP